MDSEFVIIAGLGNPGRQYEGTRHNVGFSVIDELAEQSGLTRPVLSGKSMQAKGLFEGRKVILMKPLTYMNLSGEAVGEAVRYYKADPETSLIVISDDVNLPEGKNLVGAFWQPSFVCADTDTLATLSDREWRCGCGEVAKSSVIDSDDFFFWLTDHAHELVNRDAETTQEAIARCVVFKADVVARDKAESKGVRECLNYGHTLGHAIESLAGYGTFSHGACVAEGMRFAARLARLVAPEAGRGAVEAFAEAQAELLDALGLQPLEHGLPPAELLAVMKHDKKVRSGDLHFVLADDIASWRVETLSDSFVSAALSG